MPFIRGEEVELAREVAVDCGRIEEGTRAVVEYAAELDGKVTIKLGWWGLERVPEDALRTAPPKRWDYEAWQEYGVEP